MDMDFSIGELLRAARRPLLSLEFFPPADEAGMDVLRGTATELRGTRPDFVTVTYGAGGSTRARTLAVCDLLRGMGYGPIMPHLTCVGHRRVELERLSDDWVARGFRNIMTLRGDPPRNVADAPVIPSGERPAHASDLVGLLADRHPDLCLGVAGYPEKHPEAPDAATDLMRLKFKLMAGAAFVTTQLFFDNRAYFDFVKRARAVGIFQPILPGLLPAISLAQVRRMAGFCGATLPPQLEVDLADAGGAGPAAEAVGIRWAARQICELLENGAPGIHLYILNRARLALAPELVRCLAPWRAQRD